MSQFWVEIRPNRLTDNMHIRVTQQSLVSKLAMDLDVFFRREEFGWNQPYAYKQSM